MKIKYNNFLIITPIFFAIAFVISMLNYSNEKNEIMWGVKEEASSIGIASTIFIENMIKTEELTSLRDRLLMHFNRIKRYNQAKRFYITNDKKVLIDSDENNLKAKIIKPNEFRDKDFILSEIYNRDEINLIDIYLPIKKDGKVKAILTVEIDVSDVSKELSESINEMVITIILITLIGIFVSILLSNIVIKKIASLSRVANSIAMGNYSENINVGTIREFSDLGDTLNTMKSIMQEILFKTKNSIIEEEQFRSEDDLLKTYGKVFLTSKIEKSENVEFSIDKIGEVEVGNFFNIISNSENIFCFFGRVESKEDSLSSAIHVSSLNEYLSKRFIYDDINYLNKAIDIFKIKELTLIHVNREIKLYTYSDNKLSVKRVDFENRVIFFHTFDKKIDREIEIYLKNYNFLTIDELSSDLRELLKTQNGILVLLKSK